MEMRNPIFVRGLEDDRKCFLLVGTIASAHVMSRRRNWLRKRSNLSLRK